MRSIPPRSPTGAPSRLKWRAPAGDAAAAVSPTFALPKSNHLTHRLLGFGSLVAMFGLLLQLVGDHRSTVHDRMARGRIYGEAREVLFTAEQLRAQLNGALQGERGFMLTHDTVFLEPFTAAEKEVPLLLNELNRQIRDNPDQAETLRSLGISIAEFMAFMDSEVVLEAAGNHDFALERMHSGEGRILFAKLTALIDIVVARENRLLAKRRAALDVANARTEESLRMVFWLGAVLLLLAFAAAFGVLKAQSQVRAANRKLHIAATTDALTGLVNRRAFFDELNWVAGQGERRSLALAMIDIDHFKSVNDRFGHPAGDEALRNVAAALRRAVRDGDLVARIGGEEFAILFGGLTLGDAERMCEKLRAQVALLPIIIGDGITIPVTLSVGLAPRLPGESSESLIGRADRALYRAKEDGRNTVRLAA